MDLFRRLWIKVLSLKYEKRSISFSSSGAGTLLTAVCGKKSLFRFTARGSSMSPVIRDKDVLVITPPSEKRPCTGDVVALISPLSKKLVVHRIVGKRGNFFLIKGDNIHDCDGYYHKKEIHGYVIKVIKPGGKVYAHPLFVNKVIAFFSRVRLFTFFCRLINKLT